MRPSEVTRLLAASIEDGRYPVGAKLPSLLRLRDEFFGGKGANSARAAYAPLIDCGMVQVRHGKGGGHFLVSTGPTPKLPNEFEEIKHNLAGLNNALAEITGQVFYCVEFRDTSTRAWFGRSLHPNLIRASEFSTTMLMELGEEHDYAATMSTAAALNHPTPDDGDANYTVRIYKQMPFKIRS